MHGRVDGGARLRRGAAALPLAQGRALLAARARHVGLHPGRRHRALVVVPVRGPRSAGECESARQPPRPRLQPRRFCGCWPTGWGGPRAPGHTFASCPDSACPSPAVDDTGRPASRSFPGRPEPVDPGPGSSRCRCTSPCCRSTGPPCAESVRPSALDLAPLGVSSPARDRRRGAATHRPRTSSGCGR